MRSWSCTCHRPLFAAALLAVGIAASAAAERPDPAVLLRFADGGDAAGRPARIEVSLTTIEGERRAMRRYRVLDDGLDRALVEFLDPLERGQKVLATPRELWFYAPRLHRAIRIPPAQRIFGEASYGDVARMRWSRDYDVRFDVPAEETLPQGDCWRLRLTARSEAATYRHVLLWIAKEGWIPRRAHYFVASGKLMKTVEFPEARVVDGRLVNPLWIFASPDADTRRTLLEILSVEAMERSPERFSRRALELGP